MHKINVVGLGPGSSKYILPIVSDIIQEADLLIGSKRSLELFRDKNCYVYENNLTEIISVIKSEKETHKITVIVTGDTGFYSLLDFLKKHFKDDELIVTPGISSFQYLFGRLKKSYKEYGLFSLHGRQHNIVQLVETHKKIFLLTDKEHSPSVIAKELIKAGHKNSYMAIGENLSYADEFIIEGTAEKFKDSIFGDLCVVVIEHEMD